MDTRKYDDFKMMLRFVKFSQMFPNEECFENMMDWRKKPSHIDVNAIGPCIIMHGGVRSTLKWKHSGK